MTEKSKSPLYLRRHWDARLTNLFDEENRRIVVDWLDEVGEQRRVGIVGSGFTRNAINGKNVPTWATQKKALVHRKNIKKAVSRDAFEALELFDLFEKERGRDVLEELLCRQLKDEQLRPGEAHDALWASNPIAIVTTNYLDTVLEKSVPQRHRRIIEDKQLRCGRGEEDLIPLIYFHGHRSNSKTWIAGRTQYEQLSEKKPLLLAKVRQLLAEHPTLIVGYSLTDPDFHEIYRSISEWMGGNGPPGLALMPPVTLRQDVNALEIRRKYWRDFNLRIACFSERPREQYGAAHREFLELTATVESSDQLSATLAEAADDDQVAETLELNLQIAESAMSTLAARDLPPLNSEVVKEQFWQRVLTAALPPQRRQTAEKEAQRSNLADSAHRRVLSGDVVPDGELQKPAIRGRLWVRGAKAWQDKASIAKEKLDPGAPTLRELEQLLECRGTRDLVRRWLERALTDGLLRLDSEEPTLVLAAGLLTDGKPDALRTWARIAKEHPKARRLLGAPRLRKKLTRSPNKVTEYLLEARAQLQSGERIKSRAQYTQALGELRLWSVGTREEELQGFFAAQGVLETFEWGDDREIQQEARKMARTYDEAHWVRGWLKRVEELGASARKLAARGKPDGYEPAGFYSASAPEELHSELQFARTLGCPPGWLKQHLLQPLENLFPTDESELRVRLEYGQPGTGDWTLKVAERAGFSPAQHVHLMDTRTLGAKERRKTMALVSKALVDHRFRPQRDRVEAIGRAASLLQKVDCAESLRLAIRLPKEKYSSTKLEALGRISAVTTWRLAARYLESAVSEKLTGRDRDRLDLNSKLPLLPWEHWVRCDDFLSKGGVRFVASVCQPKPCGWSENVGWALFSLLQLCPEDPDVQKITRAWLRGHRSKLAEGDCSTAALALFGVLEGPRPCLDVVEEELRARQTRREYPSLRKLLIAAAGPRDSTLRSWAAGELEAWAEKRGWRKPRRIRSFGTLDENTEAQALVLVLQRRPDLSKRCTPRLLELMDVTWDVLDDLGPILSPEVWGKDWGVLVERLIAGGHRRDANSWQVGRLRLLTRSAYQSKQRFVLPEELRFLVWAAADAVGHGDSSVANNAVYALCSVGRYIEREDHSIAVCSALRSAADDVRVDVAHGAAFAAGYLSTLGKKGHVHASVLDCTRELTRALSDDPSAKISRQLQFGRAKARSRLEREGSAA